MSRKSKEIPDPQDDLNHLLSRSAPEDGMWDLSFTDESVLSQIDYTLSTGIKSFDDIVGGMPFGRIVEVFGLESSGKSALAIRCAARARLKHIRKIVRSQDEEKASGFEVVPPEDVDVMVLYIDNEGSMDLDGKLTFEGQPIRISNFRCDTTENMLKAIDKTLDAAEARRDKYPTRKLFTVIVVDTIASTTTEKELKAKWDAQDFPRQPQLLSRGLARLVRRVNSLNACLICTNQVRTHFKPAAPGKRATFGITAADYKASGGYALRFYASHRVFLYAMESKYKLMPTAQFAAGIQIGFHTVKNRIRTPLRDGRMALLFDKSQGGLQDIWSMLETLIFLKFIEIKAKEKNIGFVVKFAKNGVVPKTFNDGSTITSFDEDDGVADLPVTPRRGGGSRKDPEFKIRADWPAFYAAHKEDIDQLWEVAMVYVASTPGLDGGITIEEEELEEEGAGD